MTAMLGKLYLCLLRSEKIVFVFVAQRKLYLRLLRSLGVWSTNVCGNVANYIAWCDAQLINMRNIGLNQKVIFQLL